MGKCGNVLLLWDWSLFIFKISTNPIVFHLMSFQHIKHWWVCFYIIKSFWRDYFSNHRNTSPILHYYFYERDHFPLCRKLRVCVKLTNIKWEKEKSSLECWCQWGYALCFEACIFRGAGLSSWVCVAMSTPFLVLHIYKLVISVNSHSFELTALMCISKNNQPL